MSEAAFLAALSATPDDVVTPLVYADWLEDQKASHQAAFLRLQAQICQMDRRNGTFRSRCRRLLDLGDRLDRNWIRLVNRPLLTGTCWVSALGGECSRRYVFRYLPDGDLNYSSPTGTFQNGTLHQVGPIVLMETNNHYADYIGQALGDRIVGSASNIIGEKWHWDVIRTTRPDLCDPGNPDRTIYHHGPPKRRRRS